MWDELKRNFQRLYKPDKREKRRGNIEGARNGGALGPKRPGDMNTFGLLRGPVLLDTPHRRGNLGEVCALSKRGPLTSRDHVLLHKGALV